MPRPLCARLGLQPSTGAQRGVEGWSERVGVFTLRQTVMPRRAPPLAGTTLDLYLSHGDILRSTGTFQTGCFHCVKEITTTDSVIGVEDVG